MRPVAAALVLAPALCACGASVSQKYESDVRFERCLALDWNGSVEPSIRRRCWDEWVRFFAVGQNRDRIEYAKVQIADIDGRAEGAEAAKRAETLPEPKSAFEPVPMMANPKASASAAPAASSAAPAAPSAPQNGQRSPCERKCDQNLEGCLSGCKVPVCEQFCAQKHGTCSKSCAP